MNNHKALFDTQLSHPTILIEMESHQVRGNSGSSSPAPLRCNPSPPQRAWSTSLRSTAPLRMCCIRRCQDRWRGR
eukprot:c8261_g1_i1 orf=2-223(-)